MIGFYAVEANFCGKMFIFFKIINFFGEKPYLFSKKSYIFEVQKSSFCVRVTQGPYRNMIFIAFFRNFLQFFQPGNNRNPPPLQSGVECSQNTS